MTSIEKFRSPQKESGESEPSSSLWSSAYAHKIELGLGTAAVTLTAAAALHLAARGSEVLVVEAAPFMGKAMRESLASAGHKVTWVAELQSLKPLVGITEANEKLFLNPRRFRTAFIDPNHVSRDSVDFHEVAPFFRDAKVRTVGTSVMKEVNKEMLASGFDLAGNKTTILTSLVDHRLDLRQIQQAPEQAQAALANLQTRINSEELAAARAQTRALIAKYTPPAHNSVKG
ncbi:MAG TPA: hypothetical protein V6C89_01655 [Drouetiella sp.]|jgi:glycine/D-amino acid oxidase-like deaminating enzyme